MQDITETATHFDNLRATFGNIIMATMIISVPLTKVGKSKCLQRLSFCGTKLLIVFDCISSTYDSMRISMDQEAKNKFCLGMGGNEGAFCPFCAHSMANQYQNPCTPPHPWRSSAREDSARTRNAFDKC